MCTLTNYMSYIEIKQIKGRKYRYKRTSYRVNGKVKHTSKYIAPVEPVKKRKKGQGRKPSIYIRLLTNNELKTLRKAKKSGDSFTKDRASILLHSVEGKTVKEICKCTSHARNTVVFAIKDFNKRGVDALQRKKAKGAKPKFTKEQKAKILQIVNTDPKKLNLHFTTWSLPKLRAYLVKSNVVESICIESIRNILRSFNVRIKKSKRWQYSNDPEFDKKNFELMN